MFGGNCSVEGVEFDDVGASGPEQFGVLRVAEAERLAGCQRNGDAPRRAVADGGLGAPRLGDDVPARRGDDPGQVNVLSHQPGHGVHSRARATTVLNGGYQAEMP